MRRQYKPIDPKELIDADDINRTSIKGEMRKLYPAIHQKLHDGGWAAKDAVKWLGDRGMEMSVELFRVYLRDLDREHGYDRASKRFTQEPPLEAARSAGASNKTIGAALDAETLGSKKIPTITRSPYTPKPQARAQGKTTVDQKSAGVRSSTILNTKSEVKNQKLKSEATSPQKLRGIIRGKVDLNIYRNNN
jgi:hypothetical protein